MSYIPFGLRPLTICAVAIVLLGLAFMACFWGTARSSEALLAEARLRLAQARYLEAKSLARQVSLRTPHHAEAALLAARAAVGLKQDSEALALLENLKTDAGDNSDACFRLAAEIALRLGHATTAEKFFNKLLLIDPQDFAAANQLAYLLGVEGRGFESQRPLFLALKSGTFTPHHLVMLAAGEPVVDDPVFADRCRSAIPEDPLPLLGQARSALRNQDFDRSEPLLRQICQAVPGSQEAQSQRGHFLRQQGTEQRFLEWHSGLPAETWHPEIWVVRGQWARQHDEPHVAARCFWEALRLDPNHRLACYQLGQLLQELERSDASKACLKRAALLEKLAFLVDRIYENPQATQLMLDAAELTESLGRFWEAWGWARCAAAAAPQSRATEILQRLQPVLKPDLPRTVLDKQMAQIELSSEPLPNWKPHTATVDLSNTPGTDSNIHFEDVATASGLRFTYDNGHDPHPGAMRMLETIGGGVAVLDFDRDGWPDIYFTQAGKWSPETSPETSTVQPPDSLFRNQNGQAYSEVTTPSGVIDRSFSQGCTIGDFDDDGFPDIYVANIGRNRLYRNQGDGTFADVTESAGVQGEHWTTSCLMADVNGDGWPDLYDVNYLDIHDAPRSLCVKGEEARTCSPGAFRAEVDQLFLNLGDGRFQDATQAAGIDIPNGKGLGIVAADLTGSGRIGLFIANDSVPNFYFVNQAPSGDTRPKFSDEALVTGLALSHDGLSAAWMGVAAGDANGDALLDLFATSYADQSKSLFQQEPNGLFRDTIVESGLNAAGWKMLGFGTQFLDADLDGNPDLIVTNGHVFDLSAQNQAYQMPPQFFRNTGGGQFSELPAPHLGAFFERKYLGRGLARLDWDRDGSDDFVVSHMNSPAGLVTNRTSHTGHSFCLRLVGTQTNRDAIGTRVTVHCGAKSWLQQLTAGDGFQASNERKLLFGLGSAEHVDEVVIEWLTGDRTVLTNLQLNREWLLIQGQRSAHQLQGLGKTR